MKLLCETIGSYITREFEKHLDKEALYSIEDGIRFTYRELNYCVNNVCENLLRMGIKKGDHVGIIAHNSPNPIIVYFAIIKIGAVCVNINHFSTKDEIEYMLKLTDTKIIIADEEIINDKKLMNNEYINTTLIIENIIYGLFLEGGSKESLQEEIAERIEIVLPEDPAAILFTSGTTGMSKGTVFNHKALINGPLSFNKQFKYTSDDVVLAALPLSHILGGLYTAILGLMVGSKVLIMNKFKTSSVLETIQNEKCTGFHGVPTMYKFILNKHSDYDISSLRLGMVAGAVSTEKLIKDIISELNITEVCNCFGQTETLGATQCLISDGNDSNMKTTGKPVDYVELRICDLETKKEIDPSMEGELCVRSPYCMSEYYNQPSVTKETVVDGWVYTGDIAVIDEMGNLIIKGRLKDVINRGGENIYPSDIENHIIKHPDIDNAVVVGVDDDLFGEEIFAFIKLHEGKTLTEEDVLKFLSDKLVKFKIPKYINFIDEIPLSSTRKIKRKELREKANKLISM